MKQNIYIYLDVFYELDFVYGLGLHAKRFAVVCSKCMYASILLTFHFLCSFFPVLLFINLSHLCFVSLLGSEKGKCVASEYFTEPEIEITTENTANILSE